MRIGIDLMGSDRSPQVLFDAVIQAAKQLDISHTFIVFADQEAIYALSDLKRQVSTSPSMAAIEFYPVKEVITMHDEPVEAVRKKKHSSLVLGIKLLKKKNQETLDAFVTAGNTGALVAAATLNLPLLHGMRRPAILASLPTEGGHVSIIDVGGNVSCKAAYMVSFAKLGACFENICHGILHPKVGLLNVGAEVKKGTHEHRLAHQILSTHENRFEFVGNVEGREIFQGKVNVLVTDGFTGNILLKTTEGVASFILDFLKKSGSAVSSPHMQHLLQQMQTHFSYNEYPGAILLGTEGVVVKCHGDSSSKALFNGIKAAIGYVEADLISKLKALL
jgi:phosphate acyltransferase